VYRIDLLACAAIAEVPAVVRDGGGARRGDVVKGDLKRPFAGAGRGAEIGPGQLSNGNKIYLRFGVVAETAGDGECDAV